MGYYTYYQVSWDKHSDESIDKAIEKKFNEITGIDKESFGWDYDVWDTNDKYTLVFQAKWYPWQNDMVELSRAYPDIWFEVSGDGEESEDLWESRWKDGCYEFHMAEFPPFTGEMVRLSTYEETKKHIEEMRSKWAIEQ